MPSAVAAVAIVLDPVRSSNSNTRSCSSDEKEDEQDDVENAEQPVGGTKIGHAAVVVPSSSSVVVKKEKDPEEKTPTESTVVVDPAGRFREEDQETGMSFDTRRFHVGIVLYRSITSA